MQPAQKFSTMLVDFVQNVEIHICAICTKVINIAEKFCAKQRKFFLQSAQKTFNIFVQIVEKIFSVLHKKLLTFLYRLEKDGTANSKNNTERTEGRERSTHNTHRERSIDIHREKHTQYTQREKYRHTQREAHTTHREREV